MAGQPTEHNGALSAALELFVTRELNTCYFLSGYTHSHIVICISSISKNTCTAQCLLWSSLWIASLEVIFVNKSMTMSMLFLLEQNLHTLVYVLAQEIDQNMIKEPLQLLLDDILYELYNFWSLRNYS